MAGARPDKIRSLNCNIPTDVVFKNRSKRTVYLFWLDYSGNFVRYAILAPRMVLRMNTYVTHPWAVLDSRIGYPLRLNGEPVYFPQQNQNDFPFPVYIDIPVYSLYRRSMEAVHSSIPEHIWSKENLPVKIKETLASLAPPVEFIDFANFGDIYNSLWADHDDINEIDHIEWGDVNDGDIDGEENND